MTSSQCTTSPCCHVVDGASDNDADRARIVVEIRNVHPHDPLYELNHNHSLHAGNNYTNSQRDLMRELVTVTIADFTEPSERSMSE